MATSSSGPAEGGPRSSGRSSRRRTRAPAGHPRAALALARGPRRRPARAQRLEAARRPGSSSSRSPDAPVPAEIGPAATGPDADPQPRIRRLGRRLPGEALGASPAPPAALSLREHRPRRHRRRPLRDGLLGRHRPGVDAGARGRKPATRPGRADLAVRRGPVLGHGPDGQVQDAVLYDGPLVQVGRAAPGPDSIATT